MNGTVRKYQTRFERLFINCSPEECAVCKGILYRASVPLPRRAQRRLGRKYPDPLPQVRLHRSGGRGRSGEVGAVVQGHVFQG
jgi:hypothetical protein